MQKKPNALINVYNHPLFTHSELHQLFAVHEKVTYRKYDYLLRQGEISNDYFVLETGLVRFYVVDYNGNEITTQFCGEDEIVNEVTSFFMRLPSVVNIQALTDCTVWKISLEDFQTFYHSMESVSEWGREWMTTQLFICQKRSINMITQSATDRYRNLLISRPCIIKHAPLKHIASYLGITDTSLSRIRKELN